MKTENVLKNQCAEDEVREARRDYNRRWRRKNPEKVAAIKLRYYRKKLQELTEQTEQEGGASNDDE